MSKMDERRKWKNVSNGEGRKNYRRLRNELKRATEKAKNTLTACVARSENFKEQDVMMNVHEDKGIRLERKSGYSNHWHRRFSNEYNSRSEKCTENLGKLHDRAN